MNISLSASASEKLVSRDGFGSPVPRQPAHLHTPAESGAYLRDSSRVPRRRPFIYFKPPYAIGSVPSLSGHAVAYRWRSPPRVRRHRGSKPQGSSERVLPWQVTMDQLIYASLSHTHYWYEVGMFKVPPILCGIKQQQYYIVRCNQAQTISDEQFPMKILAVRAVLMGTKSCTKILILPKIFPTRFRFTFYG